MYQIKYLKPVTLSYNKQSRDYDISSTLTISNDLGELFFYGDLSLNIDIIEDKLIKRFNVNWTEGKRAIDFKVSISANDIKKYFTVKISINKLINDKLNFEKISTKELKKLILNESTDIFNCKNSIELKSNELKFYDTISDLIEIPKLNELPIKTNRISKRKISDVIIYEELSGNIARHLWDAGILVSELSKNQFMDFIDLNNYQNLNILELGTGIGLVSIHLSKMFPDAYILATDLEDSFEICDKNIKFNKVNVKFLELDWESEIKTDKTWDLIITTDCTYNPLYYDALIKVLGRETSANTKILLSHKFREPISESEFFEKITKKFQLQKQIWHNIQGHNLIHSGLYTVD